MALLLAAAGALGATLGDAATAPPADVLDGLWAAKRRFGPDARGPLLVRRSGDGYVAELVGRLVPIRTRPPEVSFELPDGQGAFRGRFEDAGRIRGRWIRPGTPVNNGRSASPVLLEPDGPDRWRGVGDRIGLLEPMPSPPALPPAPSHERGARSPELRCAIS